VLARPHDAGRNGPPSVTGLAAASCEVDRATPGPQLSVHEGVPQHVRVHDESRDPPAPLDYSRDAHSTTGALSPRPQRTGLLSADAQQLHARAAKYDSYFSGIILRAYLSHFNLLSDGTL
jgi:hypothetical protein